jgi:cytochrome c-type biogenesis protein CcmH
LIIFLASCLGLLILSAVFVAVPLLRARQEPSERDDNVEWYELRAQELERDGQLDLDEDARLRLLEDSSHAAVVGKPAVAHSGSKSFVWLLLPGVVLFSAVLYHQLGGMTDVLLTERLDAIGPDTTPEQMDELIRDVTARSEQRPDNLYYLSLLARHHMGQSDYAAALAIYERMLEQVPEDPQVLAYAAQAQYLAGERDLGDSARLRAEMALAADPHQSTALGLLGMASFEQRNYRAAISYWERLLAMQDPRSESAQLIAGVINQAREALGEPVVMGANEESVGAVGAGVTVSISLPADAAVSPGDTLFVLARDASSDSRMPIAVERLSASQLPLTIRLDDRNSMAGRKISEVASVIVAAQISPDGRPGESSATWVANSAPVTPSESPEVVSLELVAN